jgi:hypothetical protein
MQLTNKYKYPASVVAAAKEGIYKPTYDLLRVTESIDSPLVKRLMVEYWDKIIIDVDEIVYSSMFGTAWHKYLAAFETGEIIEKRWSVDYNGVIVSGQTDIYRPDIGAIEDNKTQSAWAFVFGTASWGEQLNVYTDLVLENGYAVNELWINSFLRDWSKYEAMKKSRTGYPEHKFHRVQVPMWSKDKRKKFIKDRIALHVDHRDDYVCSTYAEVGKNNERWEKPTTFAVMKEGVKAARKVEDTMEDAVAWLEKKPQKGEISIVKRQGRCVRCEDWCWARNVCKFRS